MLSLICGEVQETLRGEFVCPRGRGGGVGSGNGQQWRCCYCTVETHCFRGVKRAGRATSDWDSAEGVIDRARTGGRAVQIQLGRPQTATMGALVDIVPQWSSRSRQLTCQAKLGLSQAGPHPVWVLRC